MKLIFASDSAGTDLKKAIYEYLMEKGYALMDAGEFKDYPDAARKAAHAVAGGEARFGFLFCGTGIGMAMAANKVPGIRAAVCTEPYSAKMTRMHNDANVLCLGGRVLGTELAKLIVDAFLDADYEGGRHQRRVDLIGDIEKQGR